MVREMRVPSSSNSNSTPVLMIVLYGEISAIRTDGDGLDSDALLEVCISRVIGVLALEDFLSAEGVDEGGPS